MNNETPTPRTDAASIPAHAIRLPLLPSGQYDGNVTFIPSDFARQLERELAQSKDWNTAAFAATSIASATIARLESERDQLREWVAREIQQMPDMGGGVPFAWEKLDEQSRSMWRMRADEAASRLAAQGLERKRNE